MKRQEVYNAWKEKKRQIDVGNDFSDKVINRIYAYNQQRKARSFDIKLFIEFICSNPLAKAAVITAGVLVGFIRVAFVVCMFLGC